MRENDQLRACRDEIADLKRELCAVRQHRTNLAIAGDKLYEAYEAVLPGIKHIAVQDYALINEAGPEWLRAKLRAIREDET